MPCLNEVISEITELNKHHDNALDIVRQNKLEDLHRKTQRNIISYYSGWLASESQKPNVAINDMDKSGFMNAVHEMDCDKGLDLILHTPGGSITAAESLVYYIRKKFNGNIRVIIPQMAMSAGTMIACASNEIIMGHQSCIGPFDPFVRGISAFAVFDEFKRASEEILKKPHTLPLWQTMISKYPPAFLEECEKAVELASTIVPEWLRSGMLSSLSEDEQNSKIENILQVLNNPGHTKEHSRHIHFDQAKNLGLNVTEMESDQELQDLILTVHHAYTATFMMARVSKIIESHHKKRLIINYTE